MFYTYHHSNPTPAPLVRRVNYTVSDAARSTPRKQKGIPLTFPLVPIAVLLGRRGTHTLEMLAFLVTIASREL